MNSSKKDSFILVTCPRTGSQYLRYLIDVYFRLDCKNTHAIDPNETLPMITIFREPYETVLSLKTWQYEQTGVMFNDAYKYYNNFFSYMLDHADLIIDFNQLINDPESVLDKISRRYGLVKLDIPKKYLARINKGTPGDSSTNSQFYKRMKEAMPKQNKEIFAADLLHHQVLQRIKNIDNMV